MLLLVLQYFLYTEHIILFPLVHGAPFPAWVCVARTTAWCWALTAANVARGGTLTSNMRRNA